jgi:scyllo-inositol 2-dehydrogenase (NADP+)
LTVSVVCIGAGWATGERHLPALTRDRRVRVVGIIDTHLDRAQALARRFDVPNAGASLDVPWLADANCVTIGAPPYEHGDLVEQALRRGLHCLCEKPFVLPSRRAVELAAVARDERLVLAVVHNFQFARSGRRLFELVESGKLGTIGAVYGVQLSNKRRRLPHWHGDLPGGLFVDEAPHLLYLIRRLLGTLEPRAVDVRLDGNEVRDLAATFQHDSIWAVLSMNFDSSVSEWQFVVVGSEAVAALDVFRDLLIVIRNDGSHRALDVLRSSAALVGGHVSGFAASGTRMAGRRLSYGNDEVVRRFVDAVEGTPDRIDWMTAEDGCAVVTCLEVLLERAGLAPAAAGVPQAE